jgi:hypothetical protein
VNKETPEYKRLKNKLLESINPHYKCTICKLEYSKKEDMVAHFKDAHDFDGNEIVSASQDSQEYIILNRIIEFSKKNKRRKYVDISNMELWTTLLDKLGYEPGEEFAPSNQAPNKILKKLGLLERKKGQRDRISRDNSGKRIFMIYVHDLVEVIEKSEFDDLKIKFCAKRKFRIIRPN